MNKFLTVALMCFAFTACGTAPGSSPASSVPVSTNAAQTVGNDQGSAQASEAVTATNHNNPNIFNIFGAKKTTIDGESGTVEVEGAEDAEVLIGASTFGTQRFGDEGMKAEASSGGGAAGSTGANAQK